MDQVVLFGIPFSHVSLDELCAAIRTRISSGNPGFIVTPNVDHVCRFHRDAAFRSNYANAFLVVPDGIPLMWSARLLGRPLREKLSGSDLVPEVCAYAADHDLSVFFLGGRPGAAKGSAAICTAENTNLRVVGTAVPPRGFECSEESNTAVVQAVRDANADICFVALGSPKQEAWMDAHLEASGAGVMLGVGAGLDFAAGLVKRAPKPIQRMGLEWLWRLALEPRRLWRRYLVYDLFFFILMWRELRGRNHDVTTGTAE